MSKPGWIATARQSGQRYQDRLERRPWIAFPLESFRRFKKIEGKHLALVIALNLFVAVTPLMIIGYAFIEAFNPHRDVGRDGGTQPTSARRERPGCHRCRPAGWTARSAHRD